MSYGIRVKLWKVNWSFSRNYSAKESERLNELKKHRDLPWHFQPK